MDDSAGIGELLLGLAVVAVIAIAAWELFKIWLAGRQKGTG